MTDSHADGKLELPTLPEPSLLQSLQPPDRRGLHETVFTQLLSAIRSGQVKQGERLREAEIASRLGLSRGIVREALRRLEQEGLVVSVPHQGARIARLTYDDVVEVFSLRQLLEAFAVRLAIERLTDKGLDDLRSTTQAMVEAAAAGRQVDHLRLDLRFHDQLCQLSGHRHLHKIWSGLALKLWLVNFDPPRPNMDRLVDRARRHFELIDLMERRESEAAVRWIEQHIQHRGSEILERMHDDVPT